MNTENIIFLLIGAFLSIPLGIGANLLTPRIQDWLERRAITTRGKALARLRKEYSQVKELHDNPSRLYLTVARFVVVSLNFLLLFGLAVVYVPFLYSSGLLARSSLLSALAMIMSVSILSGIVLGALLLSSRLQNLADNLVRLVEFEKYERDTLARIAELESRKPGDKAD